MTAPRRQQITLNELVEQNRYLAGIGRKKAQELQEARAALAAVTAERDELSAALLRVTRRGGARAGC